MSASRQRLQSIRDLKTNLMDHIAKEFEDEDNAGIVGVTDLIGDYLSSVNTEKVEIMSP
jgi:hypothetical protein